MLIAQKNEETYYYADGAEVLAGRPDFTVRVEVPNQMTDADGEARFLTFPVTKAPELELEARTPEPSCGPE